MKFEDEKKYSIVFKENCSCEHCGTLEPFTAVRDDEYTTWCMDCQDNIDPEDGLIPIPKKIMTQILNKERILKIEYFEKRIKELKEQK